MISASASFASGYKIVAEDRKSYLIRRAGEARVLAEQAVDDRVRTVHLEMAIRYELMTESATDAAADRDDECA